MTVLVSLSPVVMDVLANVLIGASCFSLGLLIGLYPKGGVYR